MPIKDFEADNPTAGTMKENSRLRQRNESLRKDCRQLTEKAEGRDGPNPEMLKALLAKAERTGGLPSVANAVVDALSELRFKMPRRGERHRPRFRAAACNADIGTRCKCIGMPAWSGA